MQVMCIDVHINKCKKENKNKNTVTHFTISITSNDRGNKLIHKTSMNLHYTFTQVVYTSSSTYTEKLEMQYKCFSVVRNVFLNV